MFEFKKICDTFEGLSALERRQLLEEKSGSVFYELQSHSTPESDPKEILAGFMIGSAMIDGKLNEMEYLLMYPSLVRTFGEDFDFQSVKESFRRNRDGKKLVGDLEAMAEEAPPRAEIAKSAKPSVLQKAPFLRKQSKAEPRKTIEEVR